MIPLSDYLGYLFIEITNARIGADKYAAAQAKAYASDEVMKHFSVPRFKIPEMELNIPVLIAGAKYKSTIEFNMEEEEFTSYMQDMLQKAQQTIFIKKNGIRSPIIIKRDVIKPIVVKGVLKAAGADGAAAAIQEFYKALRENVNPGLPENLVDIYTSTLFREMLSASQLEEAYAKYYPQNELYLSFADTVLAKVKENTIVVRNKIENLLVNPETQMVKEGSGEFSVFQIKAKVNEEGVFITQARNEDGTSQAIVDFE